MANLIAVFSTVFLLAITAELAFIIYKVRKNLNQAQNHLISAQDSLIKALEQWTQTHSALIASLPAPSSAKAAESGIGSVQAQKREMLERLNQTLHSLSLTIPEISATDKQARDSLNIRMAETVGALHEEIGKLFNVCAKFVQDLAQERRQLSQELLEHVGSQRAELRTLADSLHASISQPKRQPVSSPPSDVFAVEVLQSEDVREPAAQNEPPPPASSLSPSDITGLKGTGDLTVANQSDQKFRNLQQWVTANLQNIMSRSLNRWSTPAELVFDAPRDLSHTAKLLDPDSKLILIGTESHPQYLAVALPGGYIGSTFYDWFTIPKGTNVRVEKTLAPAVVEAGASGYRVVERGEVAQD